MAESYLLDMQRCDSQQYNSEKQLLHPNDYRGLTAVSLLLMFPEVSAKITEKAVVGLMHRLNQEKMLFTRLGLQDWSMDEQKVVEERMGALAAEETPQLTLLW